MRLTKQQFIDRLTPAEMAGLLAAARQSVAIEAWLFRFNSVTPEADGTSIDLNDPRTVAGVQSMEAAGLFAVGRAAEILSAQVSQPGGLDAHEGIQRGDTVRVIAPFAEFFPEPLLVESIDTAADGSVVFMLAGAGGFARGFLELQA